MGKDIGGAHNNVCLVDHKFCGKAAEFCFYLDYIIMLQQMFKFKKRHD